jgi:hypothetical protein
MNIVVVAANAFTRTADAAVAVAGAASGAVINGVVGGVQGSASGVRDGMRNGSHSTPAAALTFGLLGAAGLVEWPLLVGIGATALVLRQVRSPDSRPVPNSSPARSDSAMASVTSIVPAVAVKRAPEEVPAKTAAAKKAPAKKAAAKKAPANESAAKKAPATATSAKKAPAKNAAAKAAAKKAGPQKAPARRSAPRTPVGE